MAVLRRLPVTRADVSALVTSWLDRYRSDWTRAGYRRDLGALAAWLLAHRGRGLLETRPEDVVAFGRTLSGRRHDLDARTHPLRRHNTVATKATAWSSFFAHCVRVGALETNPVEVARRADPATAYPPHLHHRAPALDADALRALVVAAHRDPWLGGSLGACLLGVLIATNWRPERVTTRHVIDVLGRFDARTGRWTIHDGDDQSVLPEVVHGYLEAWLVEDRPTGCGPELFRDRTGLRVITAVDLMRLVHRCALRVGLGRQVTASQVARAGRTLGSGIDLPSITVLRDLAPAPEQLALPDDPNGYDATPDLGQIPLLPLPDNVRPLPLPRQVRHRGRYTGTGR